MQNTLNRKTLICYSAGHISQIAFSVFIVTYFMEFYTDVIRLPLDNLMIALFVPFMIASFGSPIMGYISDHTTWRRGRRRPYFLMGAIPAGIMFVLIITPPAGSHFMLTLYLGATMSLLFLTFTVFETPHIALAPELTYDYNERIRLSGYRIFMETCGAILGTFSIPLVLQYLKGSVVAGMLITERVCYTIVAFTIGFSILIIGVINFIGTSETSTIVAKSDYNFWQGFKTALSNKPFVILLTAFTLTYMADTICLTQIIYIVKYYFGKDKASLAPLMLACYIGSMLAVPLWLAIGNRLGKKTSYMIAMSLYAFAFTAFVCYRWPDALLYIIAGLAGMMGGGMYMMPLALAPDIIEWDELNTNQRREGVYMGIWIFATKVAMGLGLITAIVVYYCIGYQAGQTPSSQTLFKMRISFALTPTCLLLFGIGMLYFFPITKQKHNSILKQLEERRSNSQSVAG